VKPRTCIIFILIMTAGAPQHVAAQSPFTLETAIQIVLQRSLEVEAARYRVERARAEQIAAGLRPNPTVTLTAENLPIGGTAFNRLYEVAASYSETIELGGKRRLRSSVANLGVSVAEAQLADVLRQKTGEIKRLYFEALLTKQAADVALENRELFSQLLELNQARFEEGVLPEGDLLKVRLERFKFDTAVRQAELAQAQALIRLSEKLGEPVSGRALVTAIEFAPLNVSLDSLKQAALESRPDAAAARLEVELAAERIILEQARRQPDISPFAGYKRVAADNTVLFGVSVPLRIRDQNQAGIARAIADERAAKVQSQIVTNRALAEVESAYRAFESARSLVSTFQNDVLRQADESRTITLAAYEEGATDLLPVLEAQRTRSEIRQQYYRTLFEYQASVVQLELAAGRNLQ